MIGIRHSRIVVVMARVTIRRRTRVPGGVAAVACHASVRSSKRECAQIVIERRRAPRGCRMTLLTQSWESPGNMIGVSD